MEKLNRLKARLTRGEAQANEGTVVATTRTMSDDDARQLVGDLLGLYDAVTRALGRTETEAR